MSAEVANPIVAEPAEASAEEKQTLDQTADAPEGAAADATAASKPEATTNKADGDDGAAPAGDTTMADDSVAVAATPSGKSSNNRRKSTSGGGGGGGNKKQQLKKMRSQPKLTHLDAQPGDQYLVKVKGYPIWPVVIADEEMLPEPMLNKRPVTAKRPDGTYREDVADGGKKAHDRTFPVMYLGSNEFQWVPNTNLQSRLDPETAAATDTTKMKGDLARAYQLAAEGHPLDYFKKVLVDFQQEVFEREERNKAKAAAKLAAASTPVSKKSKKSKAAVDADGDTEMGGAYDENEDEDDEGATEKKSSKKRKAEDDVRRADSVKKPKIKLTSSSTPKAANGVTPKTKESSKSKTKSSSKEDKKSAPKEPVLTPEERRERTLKEVMFLRHKLQKGLLTRDAPPKEDEMDGMSDYLSKLEAAPDLEVSIIRATKIHKVLKAILKLESIPKEEVLKLKDRSKVLLDRWNHILDTSAPAADDAAGGSGSKKAEPANGVNGSAEPAAAANGPKAESESRAKSETKEEKAAEEKPAAEVAA